MEHGLLTKYQPTHYLRFHDELDAKATGVLSDLDEGQPDEERHQHMLQECHADLHAVINHSWVHN